MPANELGSSKQWLRCLTLCLMILPGLGSTARGQAISAAHWTKPQLAGQRTAAHRLPNPVRTAGHHAPIDDPVLAPPVNPVAEPESIVESSWGPGYGAGQHHYPLNDLRYEPRHAHQILRAPTLVNPNEQSKHAKKELNKKLVHPPFSSHRRRMQPEPATLPGANQRPIWKTPFSYGYFGASGTRHWSLHHGYRDRYTEWRLQ